MTHLENDFSRISNCHLFTARWFFVSYDCWRFVPVNWCNFERSLSIAWFVIKMKFSIKTSRTNQLFFINVRGEKCMGVQRLERRNWQKIINHKSRCILVRRQRGKLIRMTLRLSAVQSRNQNGFIDISSGVEKNQSRHKLEILNGKGGAGRCGDIYSWSSASKLRFIVQIWKSEGRELWDSVGKVTSRFSFPSSASSIPSPDQRPRQKYHP